MPGREQIVHADEHPCHVFVGNRFEHRDPLVESGPAHQRMDVRLVDPATADREYLVEKRQRVARRTGGSLRDRRERRLVELDLFLRQYVGEMTGELRVRQQREFEVLGPRSNGGEDLLRIGRGEHEHDVLGRFFERLQHGVRRGRRQHVDLVEDVDLAAARRAHADVHVRDQVAHRVDTVVRRGVELDEVVEGSARDRRAVLAFATRLAVGAEIEAVQGTGEDAGGRGLAGAARPREQIGVADPVLFDSVAQRGGDVFLADELAELLRPVLPIETVRGHVRTLPTTSDETGR